MSLKNKKKAKAHIIQNKNTSNTNPDPKHNPDNTLNYDNYKHKYTEDEMIVHALIKKQNKLGEVKDWIDPYKKEMEEVTNRRLQRLNNDEITDIIRRDALPLRMILENKRGGIDLRVD